MDVAAPPPSGPAPEPDPPPIPQKAATAGAAIVALGILASRVLGFVRSRVFAHYFGVGPHSDVLTFAFRAPNVIQNLLGEGTLSAAFIPIYSRLVEDGRREEAGRFAGAVFGLLLAVAATFSLLGILLARPIVWVLAPGFRDAGSVDRFELAVAASRILFPMTGFLVLAVWALGVLNSHRRFFVPYVAPVVWNAAIIAGVIWAGLAGDGDTSSLAGLNRLLFAACWGGLAGGLLQFLVQLPTVAGVLRGFRLSFSTRVPGVREALTAFGPVVAGRGVVQLASYLDMFLAALLAEGAVAAIGYAQMPYMLPISLFGISVAAAELPELSRLGRSREDLFARVRRSLRQMAFLNVPTFVGYLAFGYLIIGLLLRTGNFGRTDNWLVYLILAGYTLGLLPSTSSRLLQNTFYALGDTRTPARTATLRVALSASLGFLLMVALERYSVANLTGVAEGRPLRLGAVGLALASAVGAWAEFLILRAALARREPAFGLPQREIGRMLLLALAAAVPAALLWRVLPPVHVAAQAAVVVGVFAAGYLLLARLTGAEEMEFWMGRFGRRLRRGSGSKKP